MLWKLVIDRPITEKSCIDRSVRSQPIRLRYFTRALLIVWLKYWHHAKTEFNSCFIIHLKDEKDFLTAFACKFFITLTTSFSVSAKFRFFFLLGRSKKLYEVLPFNLISFAIMSWSNIQCRRQTIWSCYLTIIE